VKTAPLRILGLLIRLPSLVCGWIQYTSTLLPLSLIILILRVVDLFVAGTAPPTSPADDKTKAAMIGLHMMVMVRTVCYILLCVKSQEKKMSIQFQCPIGCKTTDTNIFEIVLVARIFVAMEDGTEVTSGHILLAAGALNCTTLYALVNIVSYINS
jgi:hypothetical protein